MPLPVDSSLKADQDLIDHYLHIEVQNAAAAERFIAAVRTEYERLSLHPHLGQDRGLTLAGEGRIRSWSIKGFRNYLIIYAASAKRVYVLRVLHGARDIPSLLADELE